MKKWKGLFTARYELHLSLSCRLILFAQVLNIALLRIRGRFPDMILYFVTCWWGKNVTNKTEVCVSVGRHFNNTYPGEQVLGCDVVCKHRTGARVCYF
jgi:hypothetical protein